MKLCEKCSLQRLCLTHVNVTDFVTSKLPCPRVFLAWRTFCAIYHCVWLVVNIVQYASSGGLLGVSKWFIYLSNWMYLLLTLHACLELTLVVMATLGKPLQTKNNHLAWLVKVTWVLQYVTSVGGVMVCLWYWAVLHGGREVTARSLNTHGIAALYIVLNIAVCRSPMRLGHVYLPVLFGVLYTAFTAVYFLCGGTDYWGEDRIYEVLDWDRPWKTLAVTSLSNFLFIPVVHVTLWAWHFLLLKGCGNLHNDDGNDDDGHDVIEKGKESLDELISKDTHFEQDNLQSSLS